MFLVWLGLGCQRVHIGGRGSSPEEVDLAQQRGTAALQEGLYSEAIPNLQVVVRARPADTTARYNLGVALQRVQSYRESVETLTAAGAPELSMRPLGSGVAVPKDADADYVYALGTSFQEARDFARALVCFEAVTRSFPQHLQSQYGRALALQQIGRREEARRAWEAYLKRDPSSTWAVSARKHLAALDSGS